MRTRILIAFLLLTAALGIVGVKNAENGKEPFLKYDGEKVLYGYYTSAGKWQSDETDKGKIVLLYFWATWCQPSKDMLAGLEQLWNKYQKADFAFTAIALDAEPGSVRAYMQEKKLFLPYAYLPDACIADSGMIAGVPTTYILSAQGMVLKKREGLIAQDKLEKYILKYLSSNYE